MATTTFQHGDITGVRTLVLLQGVLALLLGTILVATPPPGLYGVVLLLGGYWMVRALATVGHAYAEPNTWAGKGVIAVLGIAAGLLVFQAPIAGIFPIGMSIIAFLGLQSIVSGGTEIVLGLRNATAPLSILGLVNIVLGGSLLLWPLIAGEALTLALGLVALLGGGLVVYAAIRLPIVHEIIPRRQS